MLKKEKFQLFIQENTRMEESMHSEVELLFVLEGNVRLTIEQREILLNAEDIIVINANKRHSIQSSENQLLMRLMINYQMASDVFQGANVIFWCDPSAYENEHYKELRILLKRLLKHYIEKEDYAKGFGFLADCYSILNLLTGSFMVKAADVQSLEEGDRYEERIQQINQYINQNYDQPISMKDLSEKLFLSNGYLSRFFKKNYGMSFANYLTNVRVFHAADELLYTDNPVTAIAYNCGFASAAFFNKVFKSVYGITPSEFRKQSQTNNQTEKVSTAPKELGKRVESLIIKEEMGLLPAEIDEHSRILQKEISAAKSVEFQNYWGDVINFGSASNLLHFSMREHLMILQRALGFKYVRFWSLFTEEFHIKPGQKDYDFSQIDSILDFVLEQGMKPYIELGLKPKIIHYEIGDSREKNDSITPFTLEEWEHLMKAFMRHLSMRYGQDVLDEWRMELWFEEDLRSDQQEWNNYFTLFDISYRIIKSCNRKILVGGYGIRMDYGAEDRKQFLSLWSKKDCRPDYISIMYYGYVRGKDGKDIYAKRTTDNDSFVHLLNREKLLLEEAGMGNLPIYICEWNLTPSVRNFINDTTFKASYIMKNILDVNGKVASMGYGAGSDRQFASYDTPGMLFGGNALITKDGILKPVAFALDFMNRLFSYFIEQGNNYLITTDRHDNYAIVVHNQQVLNYNYFLTAETEMEKEAMWKYFEGRQKIQLKLRLTDLADGKYRVKVYRINYLNGSVLDVWNSMDYENELSRNDIKYLRRICEPNMTIKNQQVKQGYLDIEEEILMNEIAFIRIRKTE